MSLMVWVVVLTRKAEHEIAAMRVGGNAAMVEWWKANGIDPRSSIQGEGSMLFLLDPCWL